MLGDITDRGLIAMTSKHLSSLSEAYLLDGAVSYGIRKNYESRMSRPAMADNENGFTIPCLMI